MTRIEGGGGGSVDLAESGLTRHADLLAVTHSQHQALLFDAIVDGVGTLTDHYATLAAAITAGARAIFVEADNTDEGALTIGSGDAVEFIIGKNPWSTLMPTMTIQKSDLLLQHVRWLDRTVTVAGPTNVTFRACHWEGVTVEAGVAFSGTPTNILFTDCKVLGEPAGAGNQWMTGSGVVGLRLINILFTGCNGDFIINMQNQHDVVCRGLYFFENDLGQGLADQGRETGDSLHTVADNTKYVSQFPTAQTAGLALRHFGLQVRVEGDARGAGGSATQRFRGVIYTDSAGEPSTLLVKTEEVTVTQGDAEKVYFLFFDLPVNFLIKWMGVHVDAPSDAGAPIIRISYQAATGEWRSASDTYSDGPASAWGTTIEDLTQEMAVQLPRIYPLIRTGNRWKISGMDVLGAGGTIGVKGGIACQANCSLTGLTFDGGGIQRETNAIAVICEGIGNLISGYFDQMAVGVQLHPNATDTSLIGVFFNRTAHAVRIFAERCVMVGLTHVTAGGSAFDGINMVTFDFDPDTAIDAIALGVITQDISSASVYTVTLGDRTLFTLRGGKGSGGINEMGGFVPFVDNEISFGTLLSRFATMFNYELDLVRGVTKQLTNNEGTAPTTAPVGAIVIASGAAGFEGTTTADDPAAIGAAVASIATGVAGSVAYVGVVDVLCNGVVNVGDFISPSTTQWEAQGRASPNIAQIRGAIGKAVASRSGGGSSLVSCLLK